PRGPDRALAAVDRLPATAAGRSARRSALEDPSPPDRAPLRPARLRSDARRELDPRDGSRLRRPRGLAEDAQPVPRTRARGRGLVDGRARVRRRGRNPRPVGRRADRLPDAAPPGAPAARRRGLRAGDPDLPDPALKRPSSTRCPWGP